MAIWNSRISAPSSSARAASALRSAIAAAIARTSPPASPAAPSLPVSPAAIASPASRNSGPVAMPGAAGRPRSSLGFAILRPLVEVALDQLDQRLHRRARVLAGRAEMQLRVLRRLRRHYLDDALGIDPRAAVGKAELDRSPERLRELGELDRRAGMEPDRMGQQYGSCGTTRQIHPPRSRRRQLFGGPAHLVKRCAAGCFGRGDDGALDDRRVAHYDLVATLLR